MTVGKCCPAWGGGQKGREPGWGRALRQQGGGAGSQRAGRCGGVGRTRPPAGAGAPAPLQTLSQQPWLLREGGHSTLRGVGGGDPLEGSPSNAKSSCPGESLWPHYSPPRSSAPRVGSDSSGLMTKHRHAEPGGPHSRPCPLRWPWTPHPQAPVGGVVGGGSGDRVGEVS